jgi:phage-related protein
MGGLNTVVSGLKTFAGDVVTFFQPLTNAVTFAAGIIEQAGIRIGEVFIGVQLIIIGVGGIIATFLYNWGVGIYNALAPIWNAVVLFFQWVWNNLVNILGPPLNTMKNDITGGLNTIKVFFENTWNGIVSFFQGVWNTLVNILGPPLNTMKVDIQNFLTWMWTSFTTGLNAIKNFFVDLWNGIVSFFEGIWTSMTTSASTGATNTVNSAESPFNTLVSFLEGIWNTLVTDATNAWNSIITIVNGIITTMSKLPGGTPIQQGWNLITTGHEAQGGIVKASQGFVTHGPQLVLAGDNPGGAEAFVPLQGGNIPVTITSQGSQNTTPTFGDIIIQNPILTTDQNITSVGLQLAYTAQRELARAGYTPG